MAEKLVENGRQFCKYCCRTILQSAVNNSCNELSQGEIGLIIEKYALLLMTADSNTISEQYFTSLTIDHFSVAQPSLIISQTMLKPKTNNC